jgi:hypothetical protein
VGSLLTLRTVVDSHPVLRDAAEGELVRVRGLNEILPRCRRASIIAWLSG